MDGTILKRYATTIMDYSLSVQKGDLLVIQAYAQSAPLVEQCYKEALIRGAHPYVITRNSYDELLYEYGSDEQLAFENPIAKAVFENATKLLNIGGGDNTRYLSGIDPKKMAYHRKSMFTINEIYKNRVDQGKLDWTLCMYPTQALAQEAGMSLRNYEKFIEKACFLDQEDPIQ
ncbi:MAG TPA: aminopeptidase, partial [Eubacteriaceae bacterium]|nr:aminopeptidase [Eubacteriaceae bacterium]